MKKSHIRRFNEQYYDESANSGEIEQLKQKTQLRIIDKVIDKDPKTLIIHFGVGNEKREHSKLSI